MSEQLFQFKLKGDKKRLVKGRKGRAVRRYLKICQRVVQAQIDIDKFKDSMIKSQSDLMLYGESIVKSNDFMKPNE